MKHRKGFYERFIKVPQDVILSMAALIVLSPILLILAILVRTKLGSPVIFKQERAGKNGKPFYMYKFRSMSDVRDENGELLPDEQRLGKFGKMLRSTSLDELPSLWNVVNTSCSLCGPRALYMKYIPRYSEHQARRLEVRPGITGLAQVSGRNAISWEDKFNYDVQYVDNITFIGDLKIMFQTVGKVLKREGISSATSVTMEEFMGSEEKKRYMNNLIIIGASGFGREVAWAVERQNKAKPTWNLLGFIDDNESIQGKEINGYKVLGKTEDVVNYSDVYFVCAVGASRIREKIISYVKEINPEIKFGIVIDPSVEMSNLVTIGEGSIICANTIITVNISIGNHVIINLDCTIGHDAILQDFVTVYPSVNVSGNTNIGHAAELGTGMQIIQGKTIGEGTIVGAGAVVVKDLPAHCTAVGSPAKPIKFHEVNE